jgi:hypothetical protein
MSSFYPFDAVPLPETQTFAPLNQTAKSVQIVMGVVAGAVVLGLLIVGLIWMIQSKDQSAGVPNDAGMPVGRALGHGAPAAAAARAASGQQGQSLIAQLRANQRKLGGNSDRQNRKVMLESGRDHTNPNYEVLEQTTEGAGHPFNKHKSKARRGRRHCRTQLQP